MDCGDGDHLSWKPKVTISSPPGARRVNHTKDFKRFQAYQGTPIHLLRVVGAGDLLPQTRLVTWYVFLTSFLTMVGHNLQLMMNCLPMPMLRKKTLKKFLIFIKNPQTNGRSWNNHHTVLQAKGFDFKLLFFCHLPNDRVEHPDQSILKFHFETKSSLFSKYFQTSCIMDCCSPSPVFPWSVNALTDQGKTGHNPPLQWWVVSRNKRIARIVIV